MNYPYKNLENFTLPALLNRSIDLYAREDAFAKVGQKPISYQQFNVLVHEMIELLLKNGIKKGDKVLLLSENMPHWSIAYFAVTYFGAVIVPVLPDFHPEDVHRIIEHSEVKAAFVSNKHQQTIEDYSGDNIKFVIDLEDLQLINTLSDTSYITELEMDVAIAITKPDEDDMASLIYTSGTTGNSKGVMLSHKNIVTNAMSAYKNVEILKSDVWLSILPLAHTFECTVGLIIPILHGCSIYYVDKVPTPSVLLKAFQIVRPTMMVSVPLVIEKIYKSKILAKFNSTTLYRLLYSISFFRKLLNRLAGKKLLETFGGRLRFYGIGGAGISPYVEQFLIEAKFPYIVGYGLTETSPLLTGTIITEKYRKGCAGYPMEGVELKIVNKNPENGHGEIIARSPSVMMGYFKNQEQTDEVIKDGWFYTGDLGYIDDDGYLYINGRSKNVLISPSGENIYPEQIEAIINQNEAVADSLVIMKEHQLIALINLDMEKVSQEDQKNIDKYLEAMRVNVNSKVSSFSRMVRFINEKEPFIKTPTKKIKRYLYADR